MEPRNLPVITKHSLWITILILVLSFILGIYEGSEISQVRFKPMVKIILVYAIILWIRADSRYDSKRGLFNGIFDMTWFTYNAGFVILPYYLIKTRKGRGVVVMLLALLAAAIIGTSGYLIGITLRSFP